MRLRPPDKSVILELPQLQGLGLSAIHVPRTDKERQHALDAMCAEPFIGFDTESRPCFTAGQAPRGPDVVQFATLAQAFVLQMHDAGSRELARQVLTAPGVKVGFGVGQDQPAIERLLQCCARPMLDLDAVFHARGYVPTLGIKSAVAVVFNQRFVKSKRVTTSNWSLRELEPRQLLYAANDAHVALRVLQGLNLQAEQLPIWASGYAPEPVSR